MNENIESLQTIPYQIINDKALANQDYLFKLIIIGDTGMHIIILSIIFTMLMFYK